jgi:hypothetical protein
MVSLLGYLVNKPILVSIPMIFGSQEPRRCQLVSADMTGLWLQSDNFADFAGGMFAQTAVPVFVPFSQIICLIGPPAPSPPQAPMEQPKAGRKQENKSRRRRGGDPAKS